MIKKVVKAMIVIVVIVGVVKGQGGFASQRYNDVSATTPFQKDILDQTLMNGDGTNFKPNDNVTRAELASIILKLEQKNNEQEKQINGLLNKVTTNSSDESNTVNAIQKNVKSLVRITSKEIGSGFYVRPNLIITAYHVIDGGGKNVSIDTSDGKTITGEVVNFDKKNDIAIIQVKELGTPVTISTNITVGQTAISYGYPMGIDATANKGIVSSIKEDIQISAPINNGDSGGMLLDSSGNVIGLIKSSLVSVPNGNERSPVYLVGYATSAVDINMFLKRFK